MEFTGGPLGGLSVDPAVADTAEIGFVVQASDADGTALLYEIRQVDDVGTKQAVFIGYAPGV